MPPIWEIIDTMIHFQIFVSRVQKGTKNFYAFYINRLFSFDDKYLTSDQILSKKMLIRKLELELKGLNFYRDLMPIDQMWTFQLTMGQLASGKGAQPFVTPEDYRNWLVRLEGYIEWLESAEQNMRKGMALNYVLPKSLVVKVLP